MDKFFRNSESLRLLTDQKLFAELYRDGHVSIEIYKPQKKDFQTPHNRDELYVIISGHGTLRLADETFSFEPGDLIRVPAGVVHQFENFSDDFSTWVIFYG